MRLHIEGGQNKTADIEFRKAFRMFFSELDTVAKEHDIAFQLVLHGSRFETYKQFCRELPRDPDTFHVLLVDSETPVKEAGKCWQHLKAHSGDGWERPAGATEDHCHLMVIAMEAWFFADHEALRKHFGPKFQTSALPRRQNVEEIPKSEHLEKLNAALKQIERRNRPARYDKFADAPQILERLDAAKVQERAPHCKRLFTILWERLTERA